MIFLVKQVLNVIEFNFVEGFCVKLYFGGRVVRVITSQRWLRWVNFRANDYLLNFDGFDQHREGYLGPKN